MHGGQHGIRIGLAAHGSTLAHSRRDVAGKKVTVEFLHGRVQFVRHNGHFHTLLLHGFKRRQYAVVRTGGVETMRHVVLAEGVKHCQKGIILLLRAHGLQHEPLDAISQKGAHLSDRAFR